MKVNPQEAVASVMAYKQQLDKQLSFEQEQMFARLKKRDSIYAKVIANVARINDVELNKKTLQGIKTKADEIFRNSLNAFRKIKRPAPNKKPGGILPGLANPHNIPGDNEGPVPAPPAEPEMPQAVCFSSAIRCEGRSCDRAASMIFPKFESSGQGGPIGSSPARGKVGSSSLFFQYLPVASGPVNILSEIVLTGDVSTNTEPLYLLNLLLPFGRLKSLASSRLSLEMVIWQFNTIINETKVVVADLYSDDGSDNSLAFRNDVIMLNDSTIVTEGQWIVIEVKAKGEVLGVTSTGKALIDFGKGGRANGLDYGIHVQQLCVVPADEVIVL